MKLRDYQEIAVNAVINEYHWSASSHPIVAMPTGTGKSLVIAELCKRILQQFPGEKIMMLTHVKELIEQNSEKLTSIWKDAPLGIYSAGLKSKQYDKQIIFAGIQSVAKKADLFGKVSLIIIDECHRISVKQDGMYRKFIDDLTAVNPNLHCIGLTATPYRNVPATRTHTGGYCDLTWGDESLFTDYAFDMTHQIGLLIEHGYLSTASAKAGITADLSSVKITRGEYDEQQASEVMMEVTREALETDIKIANERDRHSIMIFATGIAHTQLCSEILNDMGVSNGVITGGISSAERAEILSDFKSKRIRAIIGVNVLTTGFDAPETDMIILLRPTKSPVLHVQIIGRGLRPTERKSSLDYGCLILDHAGNFAEHGSIDNILLDEPRPKKGEKDREKEEKAKQCPECEEIVDVKAGICPCCGYEFPPPIKEIKIQKSAIDADILYSDNPKKHDVTDINASVHKKVGSPDSVKISYYDGFYHIIDEWIFPEHTGYARRKTEDMFDKFGLVLPDNALETASVINHNASKFTPSSITLKHDGRYDKIASRNYE